MVGGGSGFRGGVGAARDRGGWGGRLEPGIYAAPGPVNRRNRLFHKARKAGNAQRKEGEKRRSQVGEIFFID